ncbi:hypothetical protein A7K93_10735 [Candidatus Methylacidiphilum fumarolicum]|nr:SOS response-associated peptidase [Candidatus Methylacidiphilum fumarolicum]TFE71493.1 hypothetical protein A7K93_10735 [Candidatus Methylacidiphilum fumarolicum]TFE72024.1 hypothetical protein A7K72_09565 [Candidatus Methylacidiphilum fumarolicum]
MPADSFYEWQKEEKNRKIPWYITRLLWKSLGLLGCGTGGNKIAG